jgi:uncharacterized protein YyaL (SSP411 family)
MNDLVRKLSPRRSGSSRGRCLAAAVFLAGFLCIPACRMPPPAVQGEEVHTVAEPQAQHTNRLKDAASPYLLQHAHNPVDWYPWGDEALQKARDEGKPIFLSIGYSACHWCHVMAHESFEDEAIAEYLNEHFVNIKVDREERPDLDAIYMSAVQIMTGSGGWPMSVWLTPDLKPFYAGTYFPPRDMYGRPGFRTVLESIVRTWETRRQDIEQSAEEITGYIRQSMQMRTGEAETVTPDLLRKAADELAHAYDPVHGGFSPAPKFPSAPSIQVLLRQYVHNGDEKLSEMALETLRKMARGGIYDHLGGGFHRYSVDEKWLVPHFEKMLYDNGQLVQAYLEAYQVSRDPLFSRVARETLDYVLRDMTDPSGGFYSAEDADSEGQEGKFYIWSRREIENILGADDAAVFSAYYGVADDGNFSSHEPYHAGQNILHVARSPEEVAAELGIPPEQLEERLAPMREKLLAEREKRVRPGRDDKILASWNALMISAFAHGYQVLEEPRYLEAAKAAADFVLTQMVKDGELQHSYRRGQARFPGYLDDYAFMSVALVDLYETDFDVRWLREAEWLVEKMIEDLWDPSEGGFYFTGETHKHLIARDKPVYDGAEPSGNSMATLALLRLGILLDKEEYREKARRVLEINHVNLRTSPRAFLKMLVAMDFHLTPPKEIAVIGKPESQGTRAMLAEVHGRFIPNKVIALMEGALPEAALVEGMVPLLKGKTPVDGHATVYVCRNFACRAPVTTPEALAKALAEDGD